MQGNRQHELPMAVGDPETVPRECRGNRAIGEDPIRFNASADGVHGVPGSGLERGGAHQSRLIKDNPVTRKTA